ncbi:phosphatidylinositol N-acetylglucosaminyltransferase [Trametes meyenii]|nr:phosphatidylinositol N-acetylglucosaminyltransferase [Trametes meyenii]
MSVDDWEAEWERVLWKKKPYPDNYVPRSFLASLSRNRKSPYTYWHLVVLSCSISQHLASIFIFLAVFMRLQQRWLDPRALVWMSGGVFFSGYMVWEVLDCAEANDTARNTNPSILVFLALMSLSPVLKTLTAATSSDSIWALSAFLFILNALLADYTAIRPQSHRRERLTSVLSMNAAISSSVVLASRLSDDISVFGLILFSVQAFALFPMLRRRIQVSFPDGTATSLVQIILTALLSGLSVILTYPLSATAAHLYTFCFTFVTFLAPAMLVWAQRYKNEIRGTWDPAVPKVYRRLSVSR